MNKTIFYKIIDEFGNSLDGFKTKEEALLTLPMMREDKKWSIISYVAADYELACNLIK